MKRLNLKTGAPYKRGDKPTADDLPFRKGKVFLCYATERVKRDGYYVERWYPIEKLKKISENNTKRQKQNIEKHRKLKKGRYERNPKTKKRWQTGEHCNDRGYFRNYSPYVKTNGYFVALFIENYKAYERWRIQSILSNRPNLCKKRGIPYSINVEYAVSIFPKSYLCPVFKTKMKWANEPNNPNSPSLDRITPSKGYVKGNVIWMSNQANKIKADASPQEIELLYKWFTKVRSRA